VAKNKTQAIVLLCLCVALLFVLSVRIGQQNIDDTLSEPIDDIEDMELPEQTPAPEEAPEETPEPTPEVDPDLPDVNISDWMYRLVDNQRVLTSSFAPDVTEDGQYFDSRAVDALNEMLEGARQAGYQVCIRAAYRPYSTQAYLFYGKASSIAWDGTVEYAEAEELAKQYVFYPGTSEHQLGLAVDIMDNNDTSMVAEDVEDMPLLVWLHEHCADYGFIARYPKNKQDITGWYEPWHFRYVGTDAAGYIMDKGLCLEEFIELY
jgi:D-alanyl-D-alanine carboxypeptidase